MKIAPSIMCSRPWDVKTYIEKFKECDIPLIHCDVMDGNYVPNISIGTLMYSSLHKITDIPLDLHLMVLNPDVAIDYFDVRPNDYVSFHPDTIKDPRALLEKIKKKGAKAGIAISPKISLDYLNDFIDILDFILIMGVEPGFSGQKMLSQTTEKVSQARKTISQSNLDIEIWVDGDCQPKNFSKVINSGADGCVVGSALIKPDWNAQDFPQTLERFKSQL